MQVLRQHRQLAQENQSPRAHEHEVILTLCSISNKLVGAVLLDSLKGRLLKRFQISFRKVL